MVPSDLTQALTCRRRRWLVTGAAGFIGSNLVEALLKSGQEVVGLDNFSTGHTRNLAEVKQLAGEQAREAFVMIEGDVRDRKTCKDAADGVDVVLHQAALGSVPASIADPLATHDVNVTGMLNMLEAARAAGAERFVYAASSATYGDSSELPQREEKIGAPLSPYGATKLMNEIYSDVYARCYGFRATGLRYFNVFGPRQDPDGAYAAVIPAWIRTMIRQETVTINGDGQTSRDFCYVANVVQANLRAALAPDCAQGQVYNVALGESTSLLDLFDLIKESLGEYQIHYSREPSFAQFRPGDVRHSVADISKARRHLGFSPSHTIREGIAAALPWYMRFFEKGTTHRQ